MFCKAFADLDICLPFPVIAFYPKSNLFTK